MHIVVLDIWDVCSRSKWNTIDERMGLFGWSISLSNCHKACQELLNCPLDRCTTQTASVVNCFSYVVEALIQTAPLSNVQSHFFRNILTCYFLMSLLSCMNWHALCLHVHGLQTTCRFHETKIIQWKGRLNNSCTTSDLNASLVKNCIQDTLISAYIDTELRYSLFL